MLRLDVLQITKGPSDALLQLLKFKIFSQMSHMNILFESSFICMKNSCCREKLSVGKDDLGIVVDETQRQNIISASVEAKLLCA